MTKKIMVWAIILTLAGFMNLSAVRHSEAAEKEVVTLTALGAAVGSPPNSVLLAMTEMWKKYVTEPTPIRVKVEPLIAMAESFKRLDRKVVDIAWGVNAFAYYLDKGIGPYAKYGKRVFYALTWGGKNFVHIFTTDPNIKVFQDLKGKKISGKMMGSPSIDDIRIKLLGFYQMTDKDIKLISYSRSSDCLQQVQEGVTDVCITISSFPSAPITELALVKKIYFVPLNEQEVKEVQKVQPYRKNFVLKAGSYNGQDKDVSSVGGSDAIFTPLDFNEERAYQMVKAIYDHLDEFHAYHAGAKAYNLEDFALEMGIWPLHPGSVRYFKEKGVWTDELESKQKELLKKVQK
ncbi:MAG: TAXI family TRAP transporter solute-binding subunit [Desulfobacterales bacterium]|nr:TAXI family TRAP transporter solute-binding subunit [Desulfobacterales bacterium]